MNIDTVFSRMGIDVSSTAFFQVLLDQLDSPVFVKDQAGKFVYVNQAFRQFIGREEDVYIGKTAPEIFESYNDYLVAHKQDKEVIQSEDGFMIMAENEYSVRPGVIMRLTKRKFTLEGQPYLIGLLVDITDLKLSEERLTKSNQELEAQVDKLKRTENKLIESEKMATVGHLTAGLAHEIGNPINYVAGNVMPLKKDFDEIYQAITRLKKLKDMVADNQPVKELLDQLSSDAMQSNLEEIHELLQGIEEGSNRVKTLLSSLKSFTRDNQSSTTYTDVNQVIHNTLKLIEHKVAAGVSIGINLDHHIPKTYLNAGQLAQVILHLVNNALMAIKGYGRIIITSRAIDDKVQIEVTDNGEGIPSHLHEKIFEPFFTTREVGDGTGLGLSICLSIMSRLEGSIKLTSQLNEGTTFTVTFPIVKVD